MYSDLLTSTDGISLERLNPSLRSEDITNWHSASQGCGFSTPGYQNSEFIGMNDGATTTVTLSPTVFTPDDDGKDDVLMIKFALEDAGYLANINIFSASGTRIRFLAKNRLLSTEDGIAWDGRDDKNQKAPIGIYIIYIGLLKPDGKSIQVKKTCVLGGKR
jgi:flagellar hook assembly protein FlgD